MTAGIVLTTIGSVLLMNNLGLIEIGSIWQYWPVILIAIGVAKLLEADGPVKD